MQGQRSSLTTFPENLSFDRGSTSNNRGHSEWSLGETSSSSRVNSVECECPLESSNNVDMNEQGISGLDPVSQDREDDECRIIEHPNRRLSCKRKGLDGEGSSNCFENPEQANSRMRVNGDNESGIELSMEADAGNSSRLILDSELFELNGDSSSSSPTTALERERVMDPMIYEESINGSISEHPILNGASTSWVGSTSRANSSSPYPRRLSEIVRRSLLSAADDESGDRQETGLSSNARSALLERHLAAASEGRSSAMSEIRHVLDLMRRGEGLRFEDMMMLDHSVLFGMADLHDRHRDMRLDVDNMSYEELLALEDRIGDVCTGLNEETITSRLKQCKYGERIADETETEPCSICREEYNEGEDIGTLECGHDYHNECIKKWLLIKNLCPICKTTGLSPPPT